MSNFEKLIADGDATGVADEVLEQDDNKQRALQVLLSGLREKERNHLALSSEMGGSRSYVTSVSLEWIAKKLKYASQLPIFREKKDQYGRIIPDAETISMIQQRDPDHSRQLQMTLYLAVRKNHKFPPILVVVTQDWVSNQDSDNWDSNNRAIIDSCVAVNLDRDGHYVDLRLSEDDFLYVIDGQHRLMGIRGLETLLADGKIFKRNKLGKEQSKFIAIEDITDSLNNSISRADLQRLMRERVGIEVIPAVMKNETQEEARRRLRSIFVHVNQHMQPLSEGEIALLNEDDGFAVVARSVMVTHPLLKGRTEKALRQLSEKSPSFTTLQALVAISTNYLGQKQEYITWKPHLITKLPIRPDEAALDQGIASLTDYYNWLAEIPSYKDIINGAKVSDYRSRKEGKAHLLFLPAAQQALAEAIGKLTSSSGTCGLSTIIRMLQRQDAENGFDITNAENPWWGVVYNAHKKKINNTAQAASLCARLLTHVLGGGTTDDAARESLEADFQEARKIDPDGEKALDLQKREVPFDQVSLPPPWP